VRYEDLVSDMPGMVARIFAHIGDEPTHEEIDTTIATAMSELGTTYDRHRTSGASADRSIGRWKHDLTDAQKVVCETHTGWFTRKYYSDFAVEVATRPDPHDAIDTPIAPL
jgi:hypothetical protein